MPDMYKEQNESPVPIPQKNPSRSLFKVGDKV